MSQSFPECLQDQRALMATAAWNRLSAAWLSGPVAMLLLGWLVVLPSEYHLLSSIGHSEVVTPSS